MNIIEAVEAARKEGRNCICRLQSNGATMAIRFVPGRKADFSYFSEDCRLSSIIHFWSPSIADLMATDYEIFLPEVFAIPSARKKSDVPPLDLSGPIYRLAVKLQDFRDALRMAGDDAIYSAADRLADMQRQGFPVKTRLKAVLAEIDRREKGRKS